MKYSNPQTELTVTDWPYGKQRTTATFSIETVKGKQRAVRTTVNPKTGRVNKPHKTTYSKLVRIVTGDDNKTYIAELTQFLAVKIMQSNMKYQHEYISDNDARYPELLELFGDV